MKTFHVAMAAAIYFAWIKTIGFSLGQCHFACSAERQFSGRYSLVQARLIQLLLVLCLILVVGDEAAHWFHTTNYKPLAFDFELLPLPIATAAAGYAIVALLCVMGLKRTRSRLRFYEKGLAFDLHRILYENIDTWNLDGDIVVLMTRRTYYKFRVNKVHAESIKSLLEGQFKPKSNAIPGSGSL